MPLSHSGSKWIGCFLVQVEGEDTDLRMRIHKHVKDISSFSGAFLTRHILSIVLLLSIILNENIVCLFGLCLYQFANNLQIVSFRVLLRSIVPSMRP